MVYNRTNNSLDIKEFPENISSREGTFSTIAWLAKSEDLLFLKTSHLTTRTMSESPHIERIYETRWSNLYCYRVN